MVKRGKRRDASSRSQCGVSLHEAVCSSKIWIWIPIYKRQIGWTLAGGQIFKLLLSSLHKCCHRVCARPNTSFLRLFLLPRTPGWLHPLAVALWGRMHGGGERKRREEGPRSLRLRWVIRGYLGLRAVETSGRAVLRCPWRPLGYKSYTSFAVGSRWDNNPQIRGCRASEGEVPAGDVLDTPAVLLD